VDLLIVTLLSGLAGFVDAVVGGGGLILVPALFATYPGVHPATLLGTNKSASVWGTLFAAAHYQRQVQMAWRPLAAGSLMALAGSFVGAYILTLVSPTYLRLGLPVVMLALLLYTLWQKNLGQHHAPRFYRQPLNCGRWLRWVAAWVCTTVFFGPGTGSFLVFLLVRVLGFDFLQASAHSKVMNLASNLAAVSLLAWQGHVWWQVGIYLAVANVAGSVLGTRMALQHGARFVRWLFICRGGRAHLENRLGRLAQLAAVVSALSCRRVRFRRAPRRPWAAKACWPQGVVCRSGGWPSLFEPLQYPLVRDTNPSTKNRIRDGQ
jgi:uncharacterized protein